MYWLIGKRGEDSGRNTVVL